MHGIVVSMATKIRIIHCYIYPIISYGCECWTISKPMADLVQAAEMWFLRKMMRISWTEHTSNEEVLRRAGTDRGLLKSIRKRQMKFFGHVMRREGLEHLAVTGKIEGKKGRGRPRVGYVKALSTWANVEAKELIKTAKNRVEWRAMTANALKKHGT